MRDVALALAATLMAMPALADVPPPIPIHHYYGPVRACQPGGAPAYAIDAVAGEGVTIASGVVVWQPGGSLSVERSSGYDEPNLADLVRSLGEVELPGVGRLRRISLGSRNAPARTIHYLLAIGGPPYADHYDVSATRFDGSDRDLALLRRVRFGEDARAACADVPAALAATLERDDEIAFWLDPAPRRGPMTMCVDDIAVDVRADERILLPWLADRTVFRVLRGDRVVGVEATGPLEAMAGVQGPLVDQAALVLLPGADEGWGAPILQGRDSHYLRLMWRVGVMPPDRVVAPIAVLSFDAGTSQAEQVAFARRLRAQRPADTCYVPGAT